MAFGDSLVRRRGNQSEKKLQELINLGRPKTPLLGIHKLQWLSPKWSSLGNPGMRVFQDCMLCNTAESAASKGEVSP